MVSKDLVSYVQGSEAVAGRLSIDNNFAEFTGKTCDGVSCNFIKKETQTQLFSC